ncbi:MAG: hypothetical protein F6K24_03535 [Okeania sp. SIO2D1]|nr:hypothetical protein [Okeania sp. SIO2D1]
MRSQQLKPLSGEAMKALEEEAKHIQLHIIYLESIDSKKAYGGKNLKLPEIEKEEKELEQQGNPLYLYPANWHPRKDGSMSIGDLPGILYHNDGKWRFEDEGVVAIEHESMFAAIAYFCAWLYNPSLRR